ncbi:MAG TPA: GNAT family N-acetyltransferase [Gemmatimonadales bacterium]|nr:GNAT family N-acetyltransferase [Gemmatimonadales bacterium]
MTATMDDVLGRSLGADPALGRTRDGVVIAPPTFALRRIRAERLDETHTPFLRRMHTDERVMATLGGGRTDAETKEYIDRGIAHWTEHGFGIWILRDRITDEPVGRAGLQHLTLEGMVEVELCYALMPEFWNRGLATDAARACVTIGRDWLGLHSVVALTLPTNVASQRVLRKAALVRERDVRHAGLRHVVFRTD